MIVGIMAKFFIGLSLISILGVASINVTHDNCPSNGFILSTLKTDGYELRATSNSNELFVTTTTLKAHIIIMQNGVSITTSSSRGVPMENNYQENHERQLEFSNKTAAKNPCESQKFPDDYEVTSGIGAHKYHNCKKNWNDARNTCISEGGHLLVINSHAEEKIVMDHLRAEKWTDTWLGIHDLFSFRDWVTVQDVSLDATGWTTWSPSNPDNWGGNQHCVRLLQEGGMDDIECDYLKNFVCKISCDYYSAAHGLDEVSVH